MSNPESNIHAALMAQVETITGYSMLWPQQGGDIPAGEHIRVNHVPNDNTAADLSSNEFERMGFLVLTLVSDLGQYEAVTKRKAGEIAAWFPRAMRLVRNGTQVKITGHTVKPGRREGGRWETPVWVSYWSIA